LDTNTLHKSYDVVVVGGGPAGTVTAYYLAKNGLKVAIIERSAYEKWRVGETLPPEIRVDLTRLGVWSRFESQKFASSMEMRWCWGESRLMEHNYLFNPYGSPWHVDRQKFDLMLLEMAREVGVDIALRTTVRSINQSVSKWDLMVTCDGRNSNIGCNFLVDSTGQQASVAQAFGAKRHYIDNLVGMIGVCQLAKKPEAFLVVEAVKDGWWYSVPLSSNDLLVGFMSDADVSTAHGDATTVWSTKLGDSVHTLKRIGPLKLEGKIRKRPAATSMLRQISGPGWLAVGDAASAHDPLSGSGISKAMHYAPIAAKAVIAALNNDHEALSTYSETIKRSFSNYLKQRSAQYTKEQRWPESAFWQRRHVQL
jgi:flavin-dependent dehydrogenase